MIDNRDDAAIGGDGDFLDDFEVKGKASELVWSPCFDGAEGQGFDQTQIAFVIHGTTRDPGGKGEGQFVDGLTVRFGLVWEECPPYREEKHAHGGRRKLKRRRNLYVRNLRKPKELGNALWAKKLGIPIQHRLRIIIWIVRIKGYDVLVKSLFDSHLIHLICLSEYLLSVVLNMCGNTYALLRKRSVAARLITRVLAAWRVSSGSKEPVTAMDSFTVSEFVRQFFKPTSEYSSAPSVAKRSGVGVQSKKA
ncbi:hypothetical protein DL770_006918 [Monosporascus sp. CRB-9-2]|nr:hypothetical protein DL770_006918 [Monosporascus sp. CRB-9-2]